MQRGCGGYGLFDEEDFDYNIEDDFISSGGFAEVFKARLKKDATGKVLDPPEDVAAKVVTNQSDPRLSPRYITRYRIWTFLVVCTQSSAVVIECRRFPNWGREMQIGPP